MAGAWRWATMHRRSAPVCAAPATVPRTVQSQAAPHRAHTILLARAVDARAADEEADVPPCRRIVGRGRGRPVAGRPGTAAGQARRTVRGKWSSAPRAAEAFRRDGRAWSGPRPARRACSHRAGESRGAARGESRRRVERRRRRCAGPRRECREPPRYPPGCRGVATADGVRWPAARCRGRATGLRQPAKPPGARQHGEIEADVVADEHAPGAESRRTAPGRRRGTARRRPAHRRCRGCAWTPGGSGARD